MVQMSSVSRRLTRDLKPAPSNGAGAGSYETLITCPVWSFKSASSGSCARPQDEFEFDRSERIRRFSITVLTPSILPVSLPVSPFPDFPCLFFVISPLGDTELPGRFKGSSNPTKSDRPQGTLHQKPGHAAWPRGARHGRDPTM